MIIYNMEQNSPEWYEIRRGKMTASHATAIGNCGTGLKTYIRKIVKDMIQQNIESYSNKDIERGNEYEPIARLAYEFENDVSIKQIGFISYNDYVGCSPDGLIGNDGGIEIKARNDDIHLGLLLGDKIDSNTEWQINMSMLITGCEWWDFVSYNPNFKKSLFVKRVYPDSQKIEKLKKGFELGEKMIKELLENENIKFELK